MRAFRFLFVMGSLLLLFWLKVGLVLARVDTLHAFPEKRFVYGDIAFGQHMMKNLRYPLEAMPAATVGTELVSIIIAPTGKLTNAAITNSLGEVIDGEV